ncbi:TPA: hypothetical protein ACH3X1_000259 [Trebouxia sp. C0004]
MKLAASCLQQTRLFCRSNCRWRRIPARGACRLHNAIAPHTKDAGPAFAIRKASSRYLHPMSASTGVQRPDPRAFAISSHPHSAGEATQVHSLLQSFVGEVLAKYWDRTPTAVTIMGLMQSLLGGSSPIYFDHLAFRTFAVPSLGIDSIGSMFTDFGYTKMDMLSFPGKKLIAYWYAPPQEHEHLPRVFISELRVDELSPEAQKVIHSYTDGQRGQVGKYAALCAASGILPWQPPTAQDHDTLLKESEYAAWTLVNGYNLNHAAVSVHRLQGLTNGIEGLNDDLLTRGFAMNEEGGILKVSPDVGLVQSSTVADQIPFKFDKGREGMVAGSYLEFAQRAVLAQYKHLQVRLNHLPQCNHLQARLNTCSRRCSTWQMSLPEQEQCSAAFKIGSGQVWQLV